MTADSSSKCRISPVSRETARTTLCHGGIQGFRAGAVESIHSSRRKTKCTELEIKQVLSQDIPTGLEGSSAEKLADAILSCRKNSLDDETTPSECYSVEYSQTKNVSNISTLLGHEDVGKLEAAHKETYSQHLLTKHEEPAVNCKPRATVWSRRPPTQLVAKMVGHLLEDHRTAMELVRDPYHAIHSRDQRAPIAQKLFHGDVNAEYITLLTHLDAGSCNRTIGILVDWDLENFSQLLDQETQTMRTGTWQFMSARLLSSPEKKHEIADDLESFVHVFRWMCIRFFPTTFTTSGLRLHIMSMYDVFDTRADGERIGGGFKGAMMLQGASGFQLCGDKTPLSELVDDLTHICKEHYLATKPEKTYVAPTRTRESVPSMCSVSQAKRDILLRHLQKARKPAPPPIYSDLLSSHDAVIDAFAAALDEDDSSWNEVPKPEDRFIEFKDILPCHDWFREFGLPSMFSKRSFETDSCTDEPGLAE